MTDDKTRCELFHAFDGHCCQQGVPCPLKPKPKTAVEVAEAQAAMQRGVFPILIGLIIATAVFFALTIENTHLERVARVDQERIAVK